MIVLMGPPRWCESTQRLLTDRTNRIPGRDVISVVEAWDHDRLRGYGGHIEVVYCTGGYDLSPYQQEALNLIEHINRSRGEASGIPPSKPSHANHDAAGELPTRRPRLMDYLEDIDRATQQDAARYRATMRQVDGSVPPEDVI